MLESNVLRQMCLQQTILEVDIILYEADEKEYYNKRSESNWEININVQYIDSGGEGCSTKLVRLLMIDP